MLGVFEAFESEKIPREALPKKTPVNHAIPVCKVAWHDLHRVAAQRQHKPVTKSQCYFHA